MMVNDELGISNWESLLSVDNSDVYTSTICIKSMHA
jgi:hypothetical protein